MFPRKAASAMASLLCISAAQAAPNWKYVVDSVQVTDLNVPTTWDSTSYDINNHGDIVGRASNSSGSYGFYFNAANNASYDITIGVAGGLARGINDNGLVVGSYVDLATAADKAFRWYWGIYATEMDSNPASPQPYQWHASAVAVNNLGNAAGWVDRIEDPNLPPQNTGGACYEKLAIRWNPADGPAAMVYCPSFGPYEPDVAATDINESGNIVGNDAKANNFSTRMFLWKQATNQLAAVPLPASTAQVTYHWGTAEGLNDSNQVVGTLVTNSLQRAFFWNGTSAQSQDIGLFANGTWNTARDINNQQMIVGEADSKRRLLPNSPGVTYQAAYLYHPHFGLRSLPALSSTVLAPRSCNATAINDRKSSNLVQVAGHCIGDDGRQHAVRWDVQVRKVPVDFPITP